MSKVLRRRPDRRRLAFFALLVGAAVGGLSLSGTGFTAPDQRPPPKRTTSTIKTTTVTSTGPTRPDLDLNKEGPEGTVSVGSTVTFTIDVGNEVGTVPAGTVITVSEFVPAGTTLTSIGGSGWTCVPPPPVTGPANVTCTYIVPTDIQSGGSLPTITVEVRIDSASEDVRNCADVLGHSPTGASLLEEATSNNEDCADVKITHTTTSTSTTTNRTTTNQTTTGGTCTREPCGNQGCTEEPCNPGNCKREPCRSACPERPCSGGNQTPHVRFRIDHFACYSPIPNGTAHRVLLVDELGRLRTRTGMSNRLCAPASKNPGGGFEGFASPGGENGGHLFCYKVGSTKLVGRTVQTGNQFGYDRLRILRPLRLCLPSAKTKTKGAPPPVPSGAHFLCYSVAQLDRPAPRYPRVALDDQFWTARNVSVLRPVAYCAPANKTVLPGGRPSAVPNASNHLECYAVRQQASFPGADVFVTNQFGSQREVRLPKGPGVLRELCLPSLSKLT